MEHTLTTTDLMSLASFAYSAGITAQQFGYKETAASRRELADHLVAIHDDAQANEDVTIKVLKEEPTIV